MLKPQHNTHGSARARVKRCAAASIGTALALGCLACMVLAEERTDNSMTDHFNGKTFFNPGEEKNRALKNF